MRNKSIGMRLLSFVLLLSLLLSMVPVGYAQETKTIAATEEEKGTVRSYEPLPEPKVTPGLVVIEDPAEYADLSKYSEENKYFFHMKVPTDKSGTMFREYVIHPNDYEELTFTNDDGTTVVVECFASSSFNQSTVQNNIADYAVRCVVPEGGSGQYAYIVSKNGYLSFPAPVVFATKNTYIARFPVWKPGDSNNVPEGAMLFYYDAKTWTTVISKVEYNKTNQGFFLKTEAEPQYTDPVLAKCWDYHNTLVVMDTGFDSMGFHHAEDDTLKIGNGITGVRPTPRLAYFSDPVMITPLYDAINSARSWLDLVATTIHDYNPALVADLRSTLDAATTFYLENNGKDRSDALTDEKIIEMADSLTKLVNDTALSKLAVDIPVTFYDFRADRLMFEAGSGAYYAYMMENPANSPADVPAFPGNKGNTLTDAGYGTKTMGLTETELANGQLVYKESTVEYIAWLIARGYCRNFGANYEMVNRALYNKVAEISAAAGTDTTTDAWDNAMGSWNATLAKTTANGGPNAGKNGGILRYSQVKTAFDLAYYITTNMWRGVDSADIMETIDGVDLPYNLTVDAYDYLRLVKNPQTGAYEVTSNSPLSYLPSTDGSVGAIYNPDLTAEQPIDIDTMRFIPMGGIPTDDKGNVVEEQRVPWQGFDALDGFEDKTDLATNQGFHFTMHAHGSFVYQKALNQYFYFLGDDDVYYYVNGKLAMDLGGGHPPCDDMLYLNDVAQELGLVDGEVYTFDMFYAERHTSASNMTFSTNIQIMDTETFTSESQFNEAGQKLPSGTKVEIGETVTYRYELLNTRDVPVRNLIFTDKSMGVTISKNVCVLGENAVDGNTAKANELTLYYYGSNIADLGAAEEKTFEEIKNILKSKISTTTNNRYENFGNVAYSVTGLTEAQLMELMGLGLPVNCRIAIHGFKRQATAMDQPFMSELYTSCEYDKVEGDVGGTTIRTVALTGAASVSTMVYVEPEFTPEEMRVVIDYGKPVDLSLSVLEENLFVTAGAVEKVTKTFLGISSMGTHGMVSYEAPADLGCVEAGDSYHCATAFGDFRRMDVNTLRYTPGQFLSAIARAYGVYRVDVVVPDPADIVPGAESVPEADRTTSYYVSTAIEIVPATMMYYEAEDFVGSVIETVNTTDAGNTSTPWEKETDSTGSADAPQDFQLLSGTAYNKVIDRETIPANAFFVDFDGEGYKNRYSTHPQYNGYDFDNKGNWAVTPANSKAPVVDSATDTLSFSMVAMGKPVFVQTGIDLDNGYLNLKQSKENIAQVRFKLENFEIDDTTNDVWLRLWYTKTKADGTKDIRYDNAVIPEKYVSEGGYCTVTVPLTEPYTEEEFIDRLRVQFFNIDSISSSQLGKVTIDYIYVGPKQGLTEDLYPRDYLYFSFDDTPADDLRYSSNTYGGVDFDEQESWYINYRVENLENSGGELCFAVADEELSYIHSGNNNKSPYAPLSYVPGDEDYCQIRMKIEGAGVSTEIPQLKLQCGSTTTTADIFGAGSKPIDLTSYIGKGYFTLKFPLDSKEYLDAEIVKHFRLSFGNMTAGSTIAIDYLYIGPEDQIDSAVSGADHLFFDFTDTTIDQLRYSNSVYGGSNFDDFAHWHTEPGVSGTVDRNQSGIDPNAGTMTIAINDTNDKSETYQYIQLLGPNKSPSDRALNYVAGENDYIQVRFKTENCRILDGKTATFTVYIRSNDNTVDVDKGNYQMTVEVLKSEELLSGNYITLTIPVEEHFKEVDVINTLRIQFKNIAGNGGLGKIVYDYFYMGPLEEANPAAKSLYFGFDNMEADRERYSSLPYGGINFDDPVVVNWNGSAGTKTNEDGLTIADGTMNMKLYPGYNWFGLYLGKSYEERHTYLNFTPGKDQYCQVRFKMENVKVSAGSKQSSVILTHYTDGSSAEKDANGNYKEHKVSFTPTEDGYVTCTFPLTQSHYINVGQITGLRLGFQYIESADGKTPGEIYIDYIYVGPADIAPEPVYGYDSSYTNDGKLSNGSSLFVEGQGVKLSSETQKYTESYFSFTGTGFDLISRTGKQQATIRVTVYSDEEMTNIVKTLTVNNKGELELYQIPVVSMQGFEYGTYYVSIGVNKAVDSIYDFLSRGGDFYFDAVRIYDPIDVTGTDLTAQERIALKAYQTDKEAYAHIKEVRNILLSAEDFNMLTGTKEGAVFIDVNSSIVDPDPEDQDGYIDGEKPETNYTTVEVQTYNKTGPKNEVYLAPKQAIAFRLQIDSTQIPASVDIGAKTIVGSSADLVAGFVTASSTTDSVLTAEASLKKTIKTSTAQYYALDASSIAAPESGEIYVVIYNNSEVGKTVEDKVISITDIKVAYATEPNAELPEDDFNDAEVNPDIGGSGSGTGNEGGTGSAEPAPEAADAQSAKRNAAEAEPVRFMVDGRTAEAVECFLKAIYETPVDDTPAEAEGIRIQHSLNLASDISINYVVSKTDLEDYENMTMNCVLPEYEGSDLVGTTTVTLQPEDKGSYYYFTLTGLTAVQMNDVIEASLSMTKDGKSYVSPVDSYSIAQYAYAQLSKENAADSLKTLCADILRYGAKAQIFKAYRTDALADAAMNDAHKSYLSDIETVTFGNTNKVLNDLENAPLTWAGKSLNLESKISLKFVFSTANFSGNLEDLNLRVSYTDIEGRTVTTTVDEVEVYNAAKQQYAFSFDGLLAAELRSVVSVQACEKDTPVSCTLQYSADTYGNNKSGTLLTLCKALFAYSDSAKSYFAS